MSINARCGSCRGARTRGAPGPGAGWTVGASGRVVVSATATVVVHGAHYP